jgi:peptide/nickel transport system substrate-binding protein
VRITFDHSAVTFPDILAGANQSAAITTAEACVAEDSKGFFSTYVGTGPFRFAEWKLGEYVRLERFADYSPYGTKGAAMDGFAGWKEPGVEHIYFWVMQDDATRLAGLETGLYDVNYNVATFDYKQLQGKPDVETVQYLAGTAAFVFNKRRGPAADPYVRQAVNACVDAGDMMTVLFGDFGELNPSYMEESYPFWVSTAGGERYNRADPELARQLLARSNYKGEPFRILATPLGFMDQAAQVLKQQLEAIGISVTVTIVDWATMISYAGDPERWDLYTTAFFSVPVPTLKLFFAPAYSGGAVDEHLQDLVSAFNRAGTRDEARRIWEELQGYSWEYLPVLHLGHYKAASAWSTRVENVTVFRGIYFWNTRVRN